MKDGQDRQSRQDRQNIELFDSHAHLSFDVFEKDLDEILGRARETGLVGITTIGSGGGPRIYRSALALARRHHDIWATVGIHPHDAKEGSADLIDEFRSVAQDPKIVAIGETGLDYHYNYSPKADQTEMFRTQIRLAKELDKPLIIHTREADDDTIAIIEEEGLGTRGGVVHCFSGGPDFARKMLDFGLSISFSGIVTFNGAKEVQEAAKIIPDHALLIETDSPFLAPHPKRGKRNEPSKVASVAEKLANLRGLSIEDVARITTKNALDLYGIDRTSSTPIAYAIRDQLYLNLTNRCTLSCVFCPKRRDWTVKGHILKHNQEPSDEQIRKSLSEAKPKEYREVVFCGLGEPTIRFDLAIELGRGLRKEGVRTRLDTDGLASLRQGRDVTEELASAFDEVCVSLNAFDAETHQKYCPSSYGKEAWFEVVDFLRKARERFSKVTASVVGIPGLDTEKARHFIEKEIGVRFRLRPYNVVG